MNKVYIADTETTGHFEEQEKPEVIELAYGEVMTGLQLGEISCRRYLPVANKISWGALAVHHILPEELLGCDPSTLAKLPEDCKFLIGHNIDHDWKALGSPASVKRICTLAMARRLWETEPGHSLGACLYRILPGPVARDMLKSAHSAKADVEITFTLLKHLLKELNTADKPLLSWNDAWNLSELCRVPRRWTFGKHKGKWIGKELTGDRPDRGYHDWCLRQLEFDPYVLKAINMSRDGTLWA